MCTPHDTQCCADKPLKWQKQWLDNYIPEIWGYYDFGPDAVSATAARQGLVLYVTATPMMTWWKNPIEFGENRKNNGRNFVKIFVCGICNVCNKISPRKSSQTNPGKQTSNRCLIMIKSNLVTLYYIIRRYASKNEQYRIRNNAPNATC